MGDCKQVRVDNWGTYFLQRLQQFFNKTDYCDLTLQFEGNVQLKVHRLVMSACTEYFQLLEQTCETVDDILMMPPDLQSDVILPIVNFMYTGILEYQMPTYEKLYKTAELMNIPVLTKLLDAQRKPVNLQSKPKRQAPATPVWSAPTKKAAKPADPDLPAQLPGRKIPVWKRKTAPTPNASVPTPLIEPSKFKQEPFSSFDNAPKPTRFEWPEDDSLMFNLMDSSFDDISYTSKPLLTQDDEIRASASSSFDDIKHLPNLNKRPKEYTNSSMDMEEMKDYLKEQKIRSDMVEDEEDDADNDLASFEGVVNIKAEAQTPKRKMESLESSSPTKRVRFNIIEKENKETTINIAQTGKMSEVNHTKIISEVLKKYPHLVKKNKNIRLKILAKTGKSTESAKAQIVKTSSSKMKLQVVAQSPKSTSSSKPDKLKKDEGPWTCTQCSRSGEGQSEFVLYYLYLKHMSEVHNEKIDSRMCKFCGHKSTKHNMLMYHQFTKHGVQPPAAYKFPKCNQCPYIALTEALLVKHKLNHLKCDFECVECKIAFNNMASLQCHMQITAHSGKSGKNNFDCQYCTKKYMHGAALFSHIKLQHREEARRDGVISIDELESEDTTPEDGDEGTEFDQGLQPKVDSPHKEIKILSNVKVQGMDSSHHQEMEGTTVTLEPSSEAEALSNVASGIATSLGLVDIVVLDDNQQYILHPNDQQLVSQQSLGNSSSEYILPDLTESHTYTTNQGIGEHNVITQSMLNNSDIGSTDELVMVLTDHDYNDGNNEILNNENSNIVVLYSHPVDGQESQFITSQGNLMLNSQTGMLEIRNTMSAGSGSDQLVMNANDTQIESIEMIQREINSHSESKMVKQDMTSSITTLPSTVEPLTQNTEILDNENVMTVQAGASVPSILEHQHLDTAGSHEVVFNSDDMLISHNNVSSDNDGGEAAGGDEELHGGEDVEHVEGEDGADIEGGSGIESGVGSGGVGVAEVETDDIGTDAIGTDGIGTDEIGPDGMGTDDAVADGIRTGIDETEGIEEGTERNVVTEDEPMEIDEECQLDDRNSQHLIVQEDQQLTSQPALTTEADLSEGSVPKGEDFSEGTPIDEITSREEVNEKISTGDSTSTNAPRDDTLTDQTTGHENEATPQEVATSENDVIPENEASPETIHAHEEIPLDKDTSEGNSSLVNEKTPNPLPPDFEASDDSSAGDAALRYSNPRNAIDVRTSICRVSNLDGLELPPPDSYAEYEPEPMEVDSATVGTNNDHEGTLETRVNEPSTDVIESTDDELNQSGDYQQEGVIHQTGDLDGSEIGNDESRNLVESGIIQESLIEPNLDERDNLDQHSHIDESGDQTDNPDGLHQTGELDQTNDLDQSDNPDQTHDHQSGEVFQAGEEGENNESLTETSLEIDMRQAEVDQDNIEVEDQDDIPKPEEGASRGNELQEDSIDIEENNKDSSLQASHEDVEVSAEGETVSQGIDKAQSESMEKPSGVESSGGNAGDDEEEIRVDDENSLIEKSVDSADSKMYEIDIEDSTQNNDSISQTDSQVENPSNDDNSQSQDDSSQNSTSFSKQTQATTVFARRESSETTKIAILDDWEDTDSQPSEQGEIKSVNVNKIIDDWEDDDDEDGKK